MGAIAMLITSMWFISKIDFYIEGISKKSVCTIYINLQNSRIEQSYHVRGRNDNKQSVGFSFFFTVTVENPCAV